MRAGPWFRLRPKIALPDALRTSCPEFLWIPNPSCLPVDDRDVALTGVDKAGNEVPLICVAGSRVDLAFSVLESTNALLLEQYHSGLVPTPEMRLPFNYSRLPNWVKGAARGIRFRKPTQPAIAFPPDSPQFVVQWLERLSSWAGVQTSDRAFSAWPAGNRAAAVITHDVDTDWVLRHYDWMKRIVDLEAEYGFRGAWYCVPKYSESKRAEDAIQYLKDHDCEVGVHGYNHDAKWPLLSGTAFEARLSEVRSFARRWQCSGFRSEWLWRSPQFLHRLNEVFTYDSSVPAHSVLFTTESGNGSSTCRPYRTHSNLLEIPLTLPLDEARTGRGLSHAEFWRG